MNWKRIRLELARAENFPKGSAGRAFLLHAPLDDEGMIDASALQHASAHALVRRFWASEADQTGRVEWADGRCLLRFDKAGRGGNVFQLQPAPLRVGQEIIVQDNEGAAMPFRVASVHDSNGRRAGLSS